mgnify:CR=1 FL=1
MSNNIGIVLVIVSLIYSIAINIIFAIKEHVNTYETKLFNVLVKLNFFGLVIELACIFTIILLGNLNLMTIAINKLFLMYICTFNTIIAVYAFYITMIEGTTTVEESTKYKLLKKVVLTLLTVSIILITFLPIEFYNYNGSIYSYGLGPNVVYIYSTICAVLCVIFMMKKKEKSKRAKIIPLLVFTFGGLITMLIQKINPALTITTSIETFIIFLMYNTIENPDVKMIEKLNIAKDQADKANRAKTDFLSNMSHEIRTPLNAIVGFSDCVSNASSLDEAKENAKDIVNASQTLLEIVNSILDISKIEAGKLEIVNSPYNARKIFEELAKLITPKMNEKGLNFTYNIAPDLPETLYGDHANIKKIITNLLSNACKYTSSGFVNYDVSCFNVNGICKLIISVEDSGRGIKKEDVDKLFTKFQRMDEDRNTTIEGTGLGLAITKQLVELMGGKIIVHTVYGEGSKFTVTIDQRIEEVKIYEAEKIQNTTLNLSDKKILLVDDNELNIKVATKLLQRYHANNITSFSNGYDCIENIKGGNSYDIILLDDMMPKLSGVETLKELKNIPNFNIPVVALTANALTGMKEKYLNEGFTSYLAKPIDKDELIKVLNEILQSNDENIVEQLEIYEYEEPIGKAYLIENNVDISKALELLGDMDMYNSTINDFVTELEEKWNKILTYKEKLDMENYAIEVHSLKSDCKYLGFTSLAEISYQHELKSKENDKDYVVNNFKTLEDEYKKVKEIATNYIDQIEII